MRNLKVNGERLWQSRQRMAGGATDPNSGPLLLLLALAYWPRRAAG